MGQLSQNGYTASKSESGIPHGLTVIIPKGAPDSKFRVRGGDVATVLQYLLDEYQVLVEDIDLYTKGSGDDWGYAYRNVRGYSRLSNHSSGTAVDVNATRHPLATNPRSNFTAKQLANIRGIVKRLRGSVIFGGDYRGRKDPMHFEIKWSADKLGSVAADIRSGKIPRTGEAKKPGVPSAKPLKPKVRLQISLKAIQAGLTSGSDVSDGADGIEFQTALNKYTGFKLVPDGVLGRNTRVVTAQAQAKLSGLHVAEAWPNEGFNSDCDGIAGKQLLTALGFDVQE